MDANEIFKQLISGRITPLIIKYSPYEDVFVTHSYRHILDFNFEKSFSDVLFDSIIFYAYEKEEIEKEYRKGRLLDLQKAARAVYENRIPKTERENDGLMGELTLDIFLKIFYSNIETLYSRVRYRDKIPHKEQEPPRKGQEIKGYDGLVFSIDNGQKYFWVGQVKTGTWEYCLKEIKKDINKSILKYYFSDAMIIMCDIMRAASSSSSELIDIIDNINDIIYDSNGDRDVQMQGILDYFKKERIKIRIPCLLMPNESEYTDSEKLLQIIKKKTYCAFKDFRIINEGELDLEILVLVFPLRDLQKVRKLFLETRKK
ncbi:MAG: SAVED domain-containing protein [Clostridia bacterium]|nr:SAVED domain-containing protein [Clostridia bacterium]